MIDPHIQVYEAEYEFFNDERAVRSTEIVYTAADRIDAIKAAGRFWTGRHINVPDVYHKLLCVKVYPLVIGPIGEDGALHNGRGLFGFEWKVDTAGCTLDECIKREARK